MNDLRRSAYQLAAMDNHSRITVTVSAKALAMAKDDKATSIAVFCGA